MSKDYYIGGEGLSEDEKKKVKENAAKAEEARLARVKQTVAAEKEKKKVTVEELMATRLQAMEDRVIIFQDPAPDEIGLIVVPEEAQKRIQKEQARGTVINVGPGKEDGESITHYLLLELIRYSTDIKPDDLIKIKDNVIKAKMTLKPGDRVLFGRFAGTPIQDPATGEELLIVRPMDIFVKL